MSCPICTNSAAKNFTDGMQDAHSVDCPQCGKFRITGSGAAQVNSVQPQVRWKISAWIDEHGKGLLSSSDIDAAVACHVPALQQRADRMLRWINGRFPPGQSFSINRLGTWKAYERRPDSRAIVIGGRLVDSRLVPIGWNRNLDEMEFMIAKVLSKEMGLLTEQEHGQYEVSPKGLLYLEGRRDAISSVGFCAMWFSSEVRDLWRSVIEPAVRVAGYEPLRIDGKEHNGKIDDEIMASIRASRFVVSDFTGNRGGVYYEAGFAHGLGLPVIFMCREGDQLHFDVRQYNCIFWNSNALEDAQVRLKNRILATLGQGPNKT